SLVLQPVFPIAWIAVEMHYRDDDGVVFLDGVNQSIRETIRPAAANALSEVGPRPGQPADLFQRLLDLLRELLAQARSLPIVIPLRLFEFLLGSVEENDFHEPSPSVSDPTTSSAGMTFISPRL